MISMDKCEKCDLCLWSQGSGGGGGSSTLSGLTDVDISNPTDGQTLVYNASAGKWENGAGGVLVVNRVAEAERPLRLDLSWQAIHDLFTAGVILVSPVSVLVPGSQDLYDNYQLFVTAVVNDEGPMYYVTLRDVSGDMQELYVCGNANDYPVAES